MIEGHIVVNSFRQHIFDLLSEHKFKLYHYRKF
jgi:hypothetical protein